MGGRRKLRCCSSDSHVLPCHPRRPTWQRERAPTTPAASRRPSSPLQTPRRRPFPLSPPRPLRTRQPEPKRGGAGGGRADGGTGRKTVGGKKSAPACFHPPPPRAPPPRSAKSRS